VSPILAEDLHFLEIIPGKSTDSRTNVYGDKVEILM